MTLQCEKLNLKRGSKGETVREIQTILQKKGLYKYKLDGEYGTETEKAVKALQKELNVTVDGWFGTKTCQKLQSTNNGTLKKGSKGTQVETLQKKLKSLGYYNASIDGNYGSKTEKAVKQYQTYYNLVNDGICGEITQKALQETKTLQETTNSKKLSKALGVTIKDHGTLYMAVLNKGKYLYYFNDIYTYAQEIQRIITGKGINCTDWAQMGMWTLIDMGFKKEHIRIVRGVVTCKNNKSVGHVWLQLYLNGAWVNYDLSAAADHQYDMPKLICNNKSPYITNINPGWALSDDGRT